MVRLGAVEEPRRQRLDLGLHRIVDERLTLTGRAERERENELAVGGMRNAATAVARVPGLRAAGAKVRAVIERYFDLQPDVVRNIVGALRTAQTPNLAFVEQLAPLVAAAVGASGTALGRRSAWRHDIVRGFLQQAGDPEVMLADWLEGGAPTGVARDVEWCGILPKVEAVGAAYEGLRQHFARIEPTANYASVEEHRDLVEREIQRLAGKGFVTVYENWEAVKARLGEVVVSKMAAIAKQRADGSTKLRLIIDMRRSHVNAHARIHERVVLPRLKDLLADAHALHFGDAGAQDALDMMVVDWDDAFHTMGVMPEEFPRQVVKGFAGEYIGYETVLFGGGGSPGVWGRAAAFLGRSGQALFEAHETRIQVYVDDPWTIWRGTPERRDRNKAVLLAWWLVLGPPISWRKVQVGRKVTWIGATVSLQDGCIQLAIEEDFIGSVIEALDASTGTYLQARDVRKLAGRAEWAASIVPYLKAQISPLWAALTGAPGDRIARSRIAHSLTWLRAFFGGTRGTLVRRYPIVEPAVNNRALIELDASPWGLGGVLYMNGMPVSWYAEPVSKLDMERFGIVIGSPKDQALLEMLAILVGVRLWFDASRQRAWTLGVRSDSQAALGALCKLRSRDARMNAVIRELALDLAEGLYEVGVVEHLPGRCNVVADALSRFYQPGGNRTVPVCLAGVAVVSRGSLCVCSGGSFSSANRLEA